MAGSGLGVSASGAIGISGYGTDIGVQGSGATGGSFHGTTGLFAKPSQSTGLAALFEGNVRLLRWGTTETMLELGEGLDYAEGFDVSDPEAINPGSVLIIDPDTPGKLALSTQPYDSKVAGIVAGAQGLGSGVRLGGEDFDHDVALAGRVYCKVDATQTGIEPGDLLTTSATAGHAMKAVDESLTRGAILGKAMQKMEKGSKGQILVLVTLQ